MWRAEKQISDSEEIRVCDNTIDGKTLETAEGNFEIKLIPDEEGLCCLGPLPEPRTC